MKNIVLVLLSFLALFLGACSNLDVGFEDQSVFHSKQKNENLKNSIVNIYLDKSTLETDKYRLVIDGEDTEVDLYYGVITRFQINKKSTIIDLLKNNQKVMSIQLDLADKKNYYLAIRQNQGHSVIEKIDKHTIVKGTKATPVFVSEEAAQQEEIQTIKRVEETHKKEKEDVAIKRNIGLKETENMQTTPVKKVEVKKVEKITKVEVKEVEEVSKVSKKVSNNKTLQEKYEAGESIFYYDPDDGE